ncbi:MBOAT family protein [Colidextribacter sp. OB.20]|uniref:MBOAT family O-acyltransferase n=1 Tax=Colidextribacter sp. OB.20 TaxID=2304568 RepID=UPI00136C6424|nr:MBOAT family protein [Colidextribacter sp. OB.20]NBI11110.1 MBOAT family protein [Colidextribacter sp. OB.20]
MVFSTPIFMFYFLALTLAVYYMVPRKLRNVVLLTASLFFYWWGERIYVVIMFLSTAIDYTHGLLVERCKAKGNDRGAKMAVTSSIIFNLLLLCFFKYWNFIAGSFAAAGLEFMPIIQYIRIPFMEPIPFHLPIGISFYTFQTMSYTIDVYRGDARAQRSILNFGTFVTLFPQLIAGPIIKYKDLGDQINERTCSTEKFASGVQILMVGLGKKLLIANNVGMLWDSYKAMAPEQLTVAGAWLGVLAFTFQIYFDFSGYSDMAVGLGRMLGFEFLPNFNYPYISKSVTEFWRRWHISLSTWFREYLYIPLGGNRCSKPRWMFNLFVVWAATGIWHGASWNFLCWGLYFFALLMVEKFFLLRPLERAPALVGHVYTMFFVMVSWAIFAIEDFSHLGAYLKVMFGLGGVPLADMSFGYCLTSYLPILCVAAAASTPLGRAVYRTMGRRAQYAVCTLLVAAGLLACTAYLVDGTYNPFLYSNF